VNRITRAQRILMTGIYDEKTEQNGVSSIEAVSHVASSDRERSGILLLNLTNPSAVSSCRWSPVHKGNKKPLLGDEPRLRGWRQKYYR
jgi:hypothetical protein